MYIYIYINPNLNFYWSIVDLQCCVSFCCPTVNVSEAENFSFLFMGRLTLVLLKREFLSPSAMRISLVLCVCSCIHLCVCVVSVWLCLCICCVFCMCVSLYLYGSAHPQPRKLFMPSHARSRWGVFSRIGSRKGDSLCISIPKGKENLWEKAHPDWSTLWHVTELHPFLWLNNIPLYGWTTFCLSLHPSMDTWVVSTFWLLLITLLWMCGSKHLFNHLSSILWSIYPGLEWKGTVNESGASFGGMKMFWN